MLRTPSTRTLPRPRDRKVVNDVSNELESAGDIGAAIRMLEIVRSISAAIDIERAGDADV
jgi:hypothetical protein